MAIKHASEVMRGWLHQLRANCDALIAQLTKDKEVKRG